MTSKRLGRGIGALIPEEADPAPGGIALIPTEKIRPNPDQPRKDFEESGMRELEQSIAQKGVVQPVTVRKVDDGFELIVGERRWRASRNIDLPKIPAYILDVESDAEMMEYALIENVQRRDLNPMELAHAYNALVEQHGLSQEEVAQRVGKSRSAITNFIRLLNLPSYLQQSVKNKEISAGHARTLLSIEDEATQEEVWEKILARDLSVREVEQAVRDLSTDGKKEAPEKSQSSSKPQKSPYLVEIEEDLQHRLGTRVSVKTKKEGGSIEIQYYSNDELERLLDLFEEIGL
ncbi:MAG: ParB/RepB/Spo0J family partition protein [Candidatus Marinimicrobia bacterium]|nr:ParB/RepB/Spo0J family partition protein [Candidatus Neomarinimicrobiota bacterium]MCF7829886.1 ParB/RepB/Spo0J family partition protein [Candidatus Neomarinimicrobiota bacterium]MCF7879151.1 ParB/RepB/Spo0J family partition protein [Candidatus Neomarinimicrobiota bacterium]